MAVETILDLRSVYPESYDMGLTHVKPLDWFNLPIYKAMINGAVVKGNLSRVEGRKVLRKLFRKRSSWLCEDEDDPSKTRIIHRLGYLIEEVTGKSLTAEPVEVLANRRLLNEEIRLQLVRGNPVLAGITPEEYVLTSGYNAPDDLRESLSVKYYQPLFESGVKKPREMLVKAFAEKIGSHFIVFR